MSKKRNASSPHRSGKNPVRFNYALLLPVLGSVLLAGAFLAFAGTPQPGQTETGAPAVTAHTQAAETPPKKGEMRHALSLRGGQAGPDAAAANRSGSDENASAATRSRGLEIAIVIDDCGPSETGTKVAIALPGAVTLSFLPYPNDSLMLSHRAHLAGHEVILHLPMQPKGAQNPGPQALLTGLKPQELQSRLEWALTRVSDFDGVNNHMGSRFTASRADLAPVMRDLAAHRLFFLDSRTTPDSQAEAVARGMGMLSGARDVFLDDEEDFTAIERQLSLAEVRARTHGSVVAIGHPHPETLSAIARWAPGLEARGFRLVSLRTVLERRAHEGNGAR